MSCKPTSSIITSKSEAQKRGIYKTPENKKNADKPTKVAKKEEPKKDNKIVPGTPQTAAQAAQKRHRKSELVPDVPLRSGSPHS